jgi:hypothetical protein
VHAERARDMAPPVRLGVLVDLQQAHAAKTEVRPLGRSCRVC